MRNLWLTATLSAALTLSGLAYFGGKTVLDASSHREAPLISNDPLADNTDLYAFRSPDAPTTMTIVANYIPLELPEGGPNYATFGEGIRYEIHIKNKTSVGALGTAKDDITYRFTFSQTNQDPTTFFNIRLGQQNLKTTYNCEKSTDGGTTFSPIVTTGTVPPNNIGPRSFTGSPAGLGSSYESQVALGITTATTGERVFCGPRDDPFFVDLGGAFDLAGTRTAVSGSSASDASKARDAVAGFNTHAIVLQIPINQLQKDGKLVTQAANILDGDFTIGVWASASRQQVTTLSVNKDGAKPTFSGPFVQVSRLGMPLTNEVIVPIGQKDKWNAVSPYDAAEQDFVTYFANPELALYMDDSQFGGAVPAISALRVQSQSYPALVIPGSPTPGFDFRNTKNGAAAAANLPSPTIDSLFVGSAFAVNTGPDGALGSALVGVGQPRRTDIFPIFYFGVPNLPPYQLATGKTTGLVTPAGNSVKFSTGKPFINNFLPITNVSGELFGGDMLRVNMAVPVTPRGTTEFKQNARYGLIRAAVIGLLTAPFNTSAALENIPHMDGFPNGRRLEDDVTTIELQAVGGLVLAAVGLGFNDAISATYADLASPLLVAELSYYAGPTKNDLTLLTSFPYLATPHNGYSYVKELTARAPEDTTFLAFRNGNGIIGTVPKAFILDQNYPNPFNPQTTIKYRVANTSSVKLRVYNSLGQVVATLVDKSHAPGEYNAVWNATNFASGTYFYRLEVDGAALPAKKAVLVK